MALGQEFEWLQSRLDEAVSKHGAAGGAVAVLQEGEVFQASSGTADVSTGTPLTPTTLFRLGSVTKLFTATAAMVLVQEGRLDLDGLVRDYVPSFQLADAEATARITVRHLLTHASGIDAGDWFVDGGRGPDAVARYVAALATQRTITDPGEVCSYCNGGMILAGHVIERVTGSPWDVAVRDLVLAPSGLEDTVSILQEDVVDVRLGKIRASEVAGYERLAAGHVAGPDGQPTVVAVAPMADVWGRATSPAGSTLSATVSDMVRFAAIHVDPRPGILSPDSLAEMHRPHIPQPHSRGERDGHGLGWGVAEWSGVRSFSHGGGHFGFQTFLVGLPDQRAAIALATNHTPAGSQAVFSLFADLFEAVSGQRPPGPRRPADPPPGVDLDRYVGRYGRAGVVITIEADGPSLRCIGLGELKPVDDRTFVAGATQVAFDAFDATGRAEYVFMGNRVHRRDFATALPVEIPATPTGDALRFALRLMAGDVADEEAGARLSVDFSERMAAAHHVLAEAATHGGWEFVRFLAPVSWAAIAEVRAADGETRVVRVQIDEQPPYRVSGLLIQPA